jgi:hypothetical protein
MLVLARPASRSRPPDRRGDAADQEQQADHEPDPAPDRRGVLGLLGVHRPARDERHRAQDRVDHEHRAAEHRDVAVRLVRPEQQEAGHDRRGCHGEADDLGHELCQQVPHPCTIARRAAGRVTPSG